MKSGVSVKSNDFRTYDKESNSEFDQPSKNPFTVKNYKKLGENVIAIAYEHKGNSIFNIIEKINGYWKSKYKESTSMKLSEQQLRQIIKEEIQLITESTRWNVGIEAPNGKVIATYGHFDGYREGVGKTLKRHYTNPSKIKQLIKLGKQGISSLDKGIKGGKDHTFSSPEKGETVFYGRDRGEKGSMSDTYRNRDSYAKGFDQEFAYLYNMKEKKWYVYSQYKGKSWELL
jgi:hypothetical protein